MLLPASIRRLIGDRPHQTDTVGMSASTVICFDDMVLKIEETGEQADNELRMMQWLSGRLPVPEVLAFERMEGKNYLLMSRVPGEMLCSPILMEEPKMLVQRLAEALQMMWAVDITDCPPR